MPLCDECKSYLPPDFVDEIKDPTSPNAPGKKQCHFCKNKTDVLIGTNNTVYKKAEVIYDYAVLIKRLAESKELRKKMSQHIVDNAVSKMGK